MRVADVPMIDSEKMTLRITKEDVSSACKILDKRMEGLMIERLYGTCFFACDKDLSDDELRLIFPEVFE